MANVNLARSAGLKSLLLPPSSLGRSFQLSDTPCPTHS